MQMLTHIKRTGDRVTQLTAIALACSLIASCGNSTSSSEPTQGSQPDGTTGTGGSTARMTVAGDYLYAIAGSDIQLFDISQVGSANPFTKVTITWDIQTLFPYGDYLLVGAADGMHILDNTDPASPRYVADFTHARAQDPVVASDGVAYVTLKSIPGSTAVTDQMDVIDISDILQPTLVTTLAMQGPTGLAVNGNRLYVCDDIAGIKIFDVSDRRNPTLLDGIRDVNCNDVIARGDILYVIDDTRLLQFDVEELPPIPLSELRATATTLSAQRQRELF